MTWDGLPKRLKVIGKRYSVSVVEKVDEEESDGESCPKAQAILLREDQGFEQGRDSALHEAVHAVDHQLGLELTEAQVRGLGTGILALLRENRSFARWLLLNEPKEKP